MTWVKTKKIGKVFGWFQAFSNVFTCILGDICDPNNESYIVLYVDNAGWHRSKKVVCPEGIELIFSLPYTPELMSAELMSAEHLWKPLKEVLANRAWNSLDELLNVVDTRCA